MFTGAAEVAGSGDAFEIGVQKPFFKLPRPSAPGGSDFSTTADHQRFLVLDRGQEPNALLDLVINWTGAVRRAPFRSLDGTA